MKKIIISLAIIFKLGIKFLWQKYYHRKPLVYIQYPISGIGWRVADKKIREIIRLEKSYEEESGEKSYYWNPTEISYLRDKYGFDWGDFILIDLIILRFFDVIFEYEDDIESLGCKVEIRFAAEKNIRIV